MIKIKKNAASAFLLLSILSIISAPLSAFAQWGVGNAPGGIPNVELGQVVINVTNWVLGIVTLLAVLSLIWGGIRYATAAGDQSVTEEAKTIISYAIWGLVVAGISYALVSAVVKVWIGGNFT